MSPETQVAHHTLRPLKTPSKYAQRLRQACGELAIQQPALLLGESHGEKLATKVPQYCTDHRPQERPEGLSMNPVLTLCWQARREERHKRSS